MQKGPPIAKNLTQKTKIAVFIDAANFDVEITFDAAVRIDQYDKLILFSGDSDFVYLVSQ